MQIIWPRSVIAFAVGGVGMALLAGVPTDVIPNEFFTRMTPVRDYDIPVLVAISVLAGVLAASYWGVGGVACPARRPGATGAAGATFGWLAIGCPVCNKLVVLALGSSGALSYFAPVQPVLGVAALGLLGAALRSRLRMLAACPARPPSGH